MTVSAESPASTGFLRPLTVQESALLSARLLSSAGPVRAPGSSWAKAKSTLARRHVIEDLLLLVGAQLGDQTAGDQRRLRQRLRRQPPADLGHHHHDLDLTCLVGIESKAKQAHLRELLPHLAAPAEFTVGDLVVSGDVVVAATARRG